MLQAQSVSDTPIPVDNWFYTWGDVERWTTYTEWQPTETRFNPPGENDNYLWLRTQLPETLPAHAAISTRFIWLSYEVYLEDRQIKQTGVMDDHPDNKYNAPKLHIFLLPEDAGGKTLYLRIYTPYPNVVGIPHEVYLGSESTLIKFALHNELSTLIIGMMLSITGLLLLFMWFHRREDTRLLLYLSIFSFCYGINYVAGHAATNLILESSRFTYYASTLFILFPVGLLGFFEQMIGEGYKSIIPKLRYTHLAFWIIVVLVDFLNVVPYFLGSFFFFGLLGISLVAMLFTLVPAMRSDKPRARIFGIGMMITIFSGLFDTILQGLLIIFDIPALSPWGVALFMVLLGVLLNRHFADNARQLREAHAQLAEYNATLEDRVARRTSELSTKNETLIHTLHELQATQDQLVQAEKMASLGQLTAGIAHEIKNPLNFVNNFASLSIELADELADALSKGEDISEILGDLKLNASQIAKHGQRADQIVRGMMQHASGGKGQREAIDFNSFVEDYINLGYHGMRARHGDLNPDIKKNYAANLPPVEIIRQDVGRVLINLVNNAFDAMREKAGASSSYLPVLEIETFQQGEFVGLKISDNGPGIPKEIKDRIFEPFFTTKPTGSGTGLGLSLSYEIIVQGHDGRLEVENNAGGGATFKVLLPIHA